MVILGEMNERYSKIREAIKPASVFETAAEVAADEKDVILSLNRDQMLSGRDTDGDLLTPDYQDDPYFKSPESAQRYVRMKDNLLSTHNRMITNPQLYVDKPIGTPNLIVTGKFQSLMYINVSGHEMEINSSYVDAPDIESKYRHKVFGLAPRSKEYFWNSYIKPKIQHKIYGV